MNFIQLCVLFAAISTLVTRSSAALKGDLTYYYEWKGNFGSCGLEASRRNKFYVAALSRFYMKLPVNVTNPNNHPYCDEIYCIRVKGKRGVVILKVSDTCGGCKAYDVDVAHDVFPLLDDPRKGRVKVSWDWVNCKSHAPGLIKQY